MPAPVTLLRARPLLGTLVQIEASGPPGVLPQAVEAAFAEIERIHQLMSAHDAASELSTLNRTAHARAQRVHRDTYAVLKAALHFAALSDGAFDPCVGDVLEDWGYLPPTRPAGRKGTARGHWRDVALLDGDVVRFARPLRLDLGGIAKGYAVDRATERLREAGATAVLVNAGGDLRVAGDAARLIGLRDPAEPGSLRQQLLLRDGAIATSGAYASRRRHAGGWVSSLVQPHAGEPCLAPGSVSIRANDCLAADALTKIVLFAPAAAAEAALAACNAVAYLQRGLSRPEARKAARRAREYTLAPAR